MIDVDCRTRIADVTPKGKIVSVQVADTVASDSVFPVADLLRNCGAFGAMKFVEHVRVADVKVHAAPLRIGRPFPQEHLHFAEIHAREGGRRTTPSEPDFEA